MSNVLTAVDFVDFVTPSVSPNIRIAFCEKALKCKGFLREESLEIHYFIKKVGWEIIPWTNLKKELVAKGEDPSDTLIQIAVSSSSEIDSGKKPAYLENHLYMINYFSAIWFALQSTRLEHEHKKQALANLLNFSLCNPKDIFFVSWVLSDSTRTNDLSDLFSFLSSEEIRSYLSMDELCRYWEELIVKIWNGTNACHDELLGSVLRNLPVDFIKKAIRLVAPQIAFSFLERYLRGHRGLLLEEGSKKFGLMGVLGLCEAKWIDEVFIDEAEKQLVESLSRGFLGRVHFAANTFQSSSSINHNGVIPARLMIKNLLPKARKRAEMIGNFGVVVAITKEIGDEYPSFGTCSEYAGRLNQTLVMDESHKIFIM